MIRERDPTPIYIEAMIFLGVSFCMVAILLELASR
jgi:hypothetical protein